MTNDKQHHLDVKSGPQNSSLYAEVYICLMWFEQFNLQQSVYIYIKTIMHISPNMHMSESIWDDSVFAAMNSRLK